jgi:hypothetical protein
MYAPECSGFFFFFDWVYLDDDYDACEANAEGLTSCWSRELGTRSWSMA